VPKNPLQEVLLTYIVTSEFFFHFIIALFISLGVRIPLPVQAASQAEQPAGPLGAFDVVSVKPSQLPCRSGTGAVPAVNGVIITCMPLDSVLRLAYGINADDQLLAEPSWVKSRSYDIRAKNDISTSGQLQASSLPLLLQAVLQERFQLRVHHEQRNLPAYALVVAKNGSRLKELSPADSFHRSGPELLMKGRGHLECHACTLDALPLFLSQAAGRRIVDQTGMKGHYEFTLMWSSDLDSAQSTPGAGPSIFTALQEQLGLKLEPKRLPTDVVVIDHIAMPSPD
jgi:uncharacterized protein (TIGR03435 family)